MGSLRAGWRKAPFPGEPIRWAFWRKVEFDEKFTLEEAEFLEQFVRKKTVNLAKEKANLYS